MDKWFHPKFYDECNHLSMMGLKLIHVIKRGPAMVARWQTPPGINPFVNTNQRTILSAATDDNFGILTTLFSTAFFFGCNIFFGNEGSRTLPHCFGRIFNTGDYMDCLLWLYHSWLYHENSGFLHKFHAGQKIFFKFPDIFIVTMICRNDIAKFWGNGYFVIVLCVVRVFI